MRLALPLIACLLLSGCATAMVTGAVVGTAATAVKTTAKVGAFAVKTTAKTAVGAGRLAYRGARAIAGGDDCDADCEGPQ